MRAFPLRARSCFPFPVGFCSLNCKQLRKSSQFFCENKTVKQTANNREKNQTIKRQTLLELLLLKILTIKKNITQKITQHSPMCFLKTIIYDITILYHKHRTPPPYTNNKCNRNKGLLLTKLDKLLSFSYYVKVSKSQKHFSECSILPKNKRKTRKNYHKSSKDNFFSFYVHVLEELRIPIFFPRFTDLYYSSVVQSTVKISVNCLGKFMPVILLLGTYLLITSFKGQRDNPSGLNRGLNL